MMRSVILALQQCRVEKIHESVRVDASARQVPHVGKQSDFCSLAASIGTSFERGTKHLLMLQESINVDVQRWRS